ncbi:MAG: ATP synthase F1 subunit gamma [Dehalococcoidia bacterium]|nr:ATP synthase F1 subunit gamma [Dehalococcoidia bacterium]
MASVRDLRRRIRSVQNTGKVTNAMSLVAASKMRRAQIAVTQGRPYAQKIQEIISHLAAQPSQEDGAAHALLQERPVQRTGVLVISPDRGLCGGMVSNLNRMVGQFVLEQTAPSRMFVVGRKARDFMVRTSQDVNAVFTELGERPAQADTMAVSHLVIDAYSGGDVDEVYLAYTRFVSTLSQVAVVEKLLPVTPAALTAPERVGYIYEPEHRTVLENLLPRFVEMEVYHALRESIASEQSARMVAMRAATDNANALVDDLTLVMNRLRQDSITNELLDLVGGLIALER